CQRFGTEAQSDGNGRGRRRLSGCDSQSQRAGLLLRARSCFRGTNGAKATFWDLTSKRTTPEFFARHTVSELLGWLDYDLENEGRLTHPMRYDAASDRYVPVSWEDAFADIGAKLQSYAPESVVFYASGRASLETSYMYQLLA